MNIRASTFALTETPQSTDAVRRQLHVVIVGHVDHGKSTLVGRLLHETGSLPDGKLDMLKAVSARRGMPFEWSFLLDALQTERDQGITIDTTQIRFKTAARDVVLIDAPGHAEFLRNMITGASQADAAILMIDAAEGVRDQTRRHAYLLHLLGISQVAVVVNKMDKVGFNAERFAAIGAEITAQLADYQVAPAAIIPVSARNGDGISQRTKAIAWHTGPTVLQAIDRMKPIRAQADLPLRMPVQAIYKFDDRRIVAGRIESGELHVGDEIVVLPAGKRAQVKSIEGWPFPPTSNRSAAGRSFGVTLDRDLFIERGDVIAHADQTLAEARTVSARIFWLDEMPLTQGAAIVVRIGTAEVRAKVDLIRNAIDPGELTGVGAGSIARNHVGEVDLTFAHAIAADVFADNPRTGRLVIDVNGRIAGGGLILELNADKQHQTRNVVPVESAVSASERRARYRHGGAVLWLTGLPAAGKSTLAKALERHLFDRGGSPIILDGDTLRAGLNGDLGFSAGERRENIRRLAEVASHLAQNGHIAIVAAISPAASDRALAQQIAGAFFREIHVATPPAVCEARDPKQHYRKARAGELLHFTGIDGSYEPPKQPHLRIDTSVGSIDAALAAIDRLLADSGIC